jgi:hypothetical protein
VLAGSVSVEMKAVSGLKIFRGQAVDGPPAGSTSFSSPYKTRLIKGFRLPSGQNDFMALASSRPPFYDFDDRGLSVLSMVRAEPEIIRRRCQLPLYRGRLLIDPTNYSDASADE